MKPDYKNWVPKGMIVGLWIGDAVLLVGTLIFFGTGFALRNLFGGVLGAVFGVAFLLCTASTLWCVKAYRAFAYDGKRQLSRQIIEGVARYVTAPANGRILDIGCGSGALTIACAKRNPRCTVTGLDRWGKEYAEYNRRLCEDNAKAEGVGNTCFVSGNAVGLDFPDESFDAVTSNYVYHNITGRDKQALLLETLRVLKKGGAFAIHDIMSPRRYGDMKPFIRELKRQGYRKVVMIDTAKGMFMSPWEAKSLRLKGSAILYGIK